MNTKDNLFLVLYGAKDVGSSHPGAGAGPKGLAVRQLKWYVSWVQNVVRQFGPYLLCV